MFLPGPSFGRAFVLLVPPEKHVTISKHGMSFPLVRIRAILPRYRTARSQQLDNTTQNTRECPLSGERTRHYPLPMRTPLAEVARDLAPRLRLCRLLARFLKTQPDLQIPAHRSRRQRKTLVPRSTRSPFDLPFLPFNLHFAPFPE
jgi:hypothetical protein